MKEKIEDFKIFEENVFFSEENTNFNKD